jgi:putative endonuclease
MFYVYVLKSLKSKRLYVGFTEDLKRRLDEHNRGSGGKFSKINKPFKLVFYEAFLDKKDAIKQEKFYKSGHGREVLKQKIENSLKLVV